MPGLTICLSNKPITGPRREQLRKATALMLHQPRYHSEIVAEQDHLDVRFTAYNQYPRLKSENPASLLFIEGAIYNKPKLQVILEWERLGTHLLHDQAEGQQAAERWILENDGEYIALFLDKESGNVALITDALGRLPLFHFESPEGLLVSREPKYIIAAANNRRLDPIGVAEFLMHGYNMGDRTMSEGIKRFAPATLVTFSPRRQTLEFRILHQWIIESELDHATTFADFAERAVTQFRDACRQRVEHFEDSDATLALSGGLDSRAVAGALGREHLTFSAHTTMDPGHENAMDASIARRAAAVIGCPWSQYQLHKDLPADAMTIVRHQEGGSATWLASAPQHYRQIAKDHGDHALVFTGDGGNNVMYPFLASAAIRSIDDILRITFDTVYNWDIETIVKILRVDCADVRQAFADAIATYPENAFEWKYGHFKFLGRPYRFVMEGEDRTRFYYWLGAPFWATPLVRTLLRLPETYKRNFRWYRAFLQRINPKLTRIPYAATLIRVPFPLLPLYATGTGFIKSHPIIYRSLRTILVRRRVPTFAIAGLGNTLQRVINESPIIEEYFDVKELRRLYEAGLPRVNYHLLATLLLRVDLLEGNRTQD